MPAATKKRPPARPTPRAAAPTPLDDLIRRASRRATGPAAAWLRALAAAGGRA